MSYHYSAQRLMKTLLRKRQTGLYLQAPGAWTRDPSQALDFRFIDRALGYVAVWGLDAVEVTFAFEDPQSITAVSLERTAVHYAAA
jgi:hypothetical protein